MYKVSPQQKKLISLLIKVMITVLTLGYLYYKLFQEKTLQDLTKDFQFTFEYSKFYLLAGLIVLMLFNWGLETYKWQKLMHKLEKLSFLRAYKAVLAGVTVSFFTPNRVGEFMGRIIFLRKSNKVKAILGTIIGSFSQVACTSVFGALGVGWHYAEYSNTYVIFQPWFVILFAIGMLLLYFNIGIGHWVAKKLKIKAISRYTAILTRYSKRELLNVLLLSAVRYAVFASQYVIMLYLFDVNVGFFKALGAVSVIFLVQTSIPSLGFSELGNRGVAVVYAFEFFAGVNELSLLAAAYSLWLLNIAVPSILGLIFILQARLFPKA